MDTERALDSLSTGLFISIYLPQFYPPLEYKVHDTLNAFVDVTNVPDKLDAADRLDVAERLDVAHRLDVADRLDVLRKLLPCSVGEKEVRAQHPFGRVHLGLRTIELTSVWRELDTRDK